MRPRQLVLDLAARPALGRADFFVAKANRLALAQIERWPDWPERKLALSGPAGAGKTHLVHVWAARSGARILPAASLGAGGLGEGAGAIAADAAVAVEDADRLPGGAARARAEESLFHLHNRLAFGGGSLLLTGRAPPSRWPVALPDLASRLEATSLALLDPPDDGLLAAVIVKLFEDRQVEAAPELVAFLLPRIERSFAAARAVVARLDRAALARRRKLTARLAAELLGPG